MGYHIMYVIGASVIFFSSVLTLNRAVLGNFHTITESSMILTSTSIGQEIIEEAQGKLYDEVLSDSESFYDIPVCFTADDSLGPEGGEYYPLFDDIDDYNGLTRLVSTPSGACSVAVKVGYVDSLNINQWVTGKGFYKRMEVSVYTDVNPYSIKLHYLFCYYK